MYYDSFFLFFFGKHNDRNREGMRRVDSKLENYSCPREIFHPFELFLETTLECVMLNSKHVPFFMPTLNIVIEI